MSVVFGGWSRACVFILVDLVSCPSAAFLGVSSKFQIGHGLAAASLATGVDRHAELLRSTRFSSRGWALPCPELSPSGPV